MLTDFTKLTRDNIVDLLEKQGYTETSKDIETVEFDPSWHRTWCGPLKYKIAWNNGRKTDTVYVFIDGDGQLAADY